MQPLADVKVLDFSTLLPGPLATLLLAEAGANVIKIEPPGGDPMRHYPPGLGEGMGGVFALLNRGKRSIEIDLKMQESMPKLLPLVESADVLVEQFRPGVMDRLGLGYDTLRKVNPALVYCSITGYGQNGPKKNQPGHDMNYMAEAGLLNLTKAADGAPVIPQVLAADIAGGAYPAMMNILLALMQREKTGAGMYLDVAMTDNLFPLISWALAMGFGADQWPVSGQELLTGGSPRYQIYRTRDDAFIAAAPLEEKFWRNFCKAIDLPAEFRNDADDPAATMAAVAERIRQADSVYWQEVFSQSDTCCSVVQDLESAVKDEHIKLRGLFDQEMKLGNGKSIPAMPLPIVFTSEQSLLPPELGEANNEYL